MAFRTSTFRHSAFSFSFIYFYYYCHVDSDQKKIVSQHKISHSHKQQHISQELKFCRFQWNIASDIFTKTEWQFSRTGNSWVIQFGFHLLLSFSLFLSHSHSFICCWTLRFMMLCIWFITLTISHTRCRKKRYNATHPCQKHHRIDIIELWNRTFFLSLVQTEGCFQASWISRWSVKATERCAILLKKKKNNYSQMGDSSYIMVANQWSHRHIRIPRAYRSLHRHTKPWKRKTPLENLYERMIRNDGKKKKKINIARIEFVFTWFHQSN